MARIGNLAGDHGVMLIECPYHRVYHTGTHEQLDRTLLRCWAEVPPVLVNLMVKLGISTKHEGWA